MSLPSRFWTLSLALTAVMASSGCVCVTTPTGGSGDITFTWSFNGAGCTAVPDVASIAITIPGETLTNGGVYGCVNGNPPVAGIVLEKFRPGTYNFTISARNTAGQTLYEASGKVTVNGSVAVDVTLLPLAGVKGSTRFFWTFPSTGPVIDCNTISAVDVYINDALIQSFDCWTGFAGDVNHAAGNGALITGITPGQNSLTLTARDANDAYYYRSDRTFTAVAGGETAENTTLEWAVGLLPIKWTFSDGVSQLTCEQAGVTSVYVNFKDSSGSLVYGGAGAQVPCRNNDGVQGQVFYLYTGNYSVYVQATDPGGNLYSTNQTTPPSGSVQAGSFPIIDNPTPTPVLVLTR